MLSQGDSVFGLKLVMLGNSGVGKTSLVSAWVNGSAKVDVVPTVGAVNQSKQVNIKDQQVDVFLWDTAGQEQFRSIAPLYIRSASVGVITVSADDPRTLSEIPGWYELLVESCDTPPPAVLAINKSDLGPTFSVESVVSMYSEYFKDVVLVSALTGEGVNELFMKASEYGYDYAASLVHKERINTVDNIANKNGNCC